MSEEINRRGKRYIGEVVALDRDCELGLVGERAVVIALHRDSRMTLVFPNRDVRRQVCTMNDYRFLVRQ